MSAPMPYRDRDAEEVVALMAEVPELPSTSADAFRGFVSLSFNREGRDFRVLRAGGRMVGLLTSTLLAESGLSIRHFRIAVHPDCRRRGVGTRLLAEVEGQEAPPGTALQCNSQASWLPGNAFLERAGFAVARTELLMQRRLPGAAVEPPVGCRIRPATPADDDAWMSLHAGAYGERDDFTPLTPTDVRAERESPGFVLVVAEVDGEVIGLCHGLELAAGEGLINSLVVHPSARGRGLGGALLAAGLDLLAAGGLEAVSLNVVSTNLAAIAVYRRLGFELQDQMLSFRRSVARRAAAPISPASADRSR